MGYESAVGKQRFRTEKKGVSCSCFDHLKFYFNVTFPFIEVQRNCMHNNCNSLSCGL